MLRSTDRVLTTHVGSLPRSAELSDLLIRDEAGEAIDKTRMIRLGEEAVHHVVAQQCAVGIRHRERWRAATSSASKPMSPSA